MKPVPDQSWPLQRCPEDPHAGDELLPIESAGTAAAFEALYQDAVRGRIPFSDRRLGELARAAGLDDPPLPDTGRPPPPDLQVAPVVPQDVWLADIAEDRLPDVGLALERVLGPLAEEAPPRPLRVLAAGVLALSPYVEPRVRPADRFCQDRRASPPAERAAVRAADRAPPLAWRCSGGRVHPLLPLATGLVPPDPVYLPPAAPGQPPPLLGDGTWAARLVPCADGRWYAILALPVRDVGALAALGPRMYVEAWRHRLHFPALRWEDCLRDRGEVLYRHLCEAAWLAREET